MVRRRTSCRKKQSKSESSAAEEWQACMLTFMEIYGENATLICDDSGVSVVANEFKTTYNILQTDVHEAQMKRMLAMTTDRTEPPCTLKDGIIAAATAISVMEPVPFNLEFLKDFEK